VSAQRNGARTKLWQQRWQRVGPLPQIRVWNRHRKMWGKKQNGLEMRVARKGMRRGATGLGKRGRETRERSDEGVGNQARNWNNAWVEDRKANCGLTRPQFALGRCRKNGGAPVPCPH